MHASRNPFGRAHNWSRALALVFIAALFVGSAYGVSLAEDENDKPKKPAAPPTSADQVRAFADVLERFAETPTLDLGNQFRAAMNPELAVSRRAPRLVKPFVFHTDTDGDSILALKTTRSIKRSALGEIESDVPIALVRRDPATGNETTLYNSTGSSAVPVSVVGDGAAAMSVWKNSESEKEVELSGSLLYAAEGSSEMKVIATSSIKVGRKTEKVCGSFDFVVAMIGRTTPVVASIAASCGEATTISASLKQVNPDGSVATLFAPISLDAAFGSSLVVGKDAVMTSSPFDASTGLGRFANQDFTSLWNGTTVSSALADDGTVAMLGAPSSDEFELEELFDTQREGTKIPLLLFPQGNPDSVNVLAENAGRITKTIFCGSTLYALKSVETSPPDFDDLFFGDSPDVFIQLFAPDRVKTKIIAYKSSGELIGNLGTTPTMALSSVGCSGESLVMIATRGLNTSQLRYQP